MITIIVVGVVAIAAIYIIIKKNKKDDSSKHVPDYTLHNEVPTPEEAEKELREAQLEALAQKAAEKIEAEKR